MLKIEKVKIKNFKCISDIETALKPFTVLIGPNDSGKTSFMEAIYFISKIARSKDTASLLRDQTIWNQGRKIFQKGKEKNLGYAIDIHFTLGPRKGHYHLSLRPGQGSKRYEISGESLKFEGNEFQWKEKSGSEWHFEKNGKIIEESRNVPAFSLLKKRDHGLDLFGEEFQGMTLFHLDPEAPARDAALDGGMDILNLKRNGEGLPALLAKLALTDRERISRIEQDLNRITRSRIVSISTPPRSVLIQGGIQPESASGYGLEFKLNSGVTVPARETSTGILYALCILTVVHHPDPPNIIFLEEPENSVHPSRLKEIVEYLRLLATRTDGPSVQIIAATHSPYLLDSCKHDEILVFNRDSLDNMTRVSKVNPEAFNEKEWALSLGEIWGSYGEDGLLNRHSSKNNKVAE